MNTTLQLMQMLKPSDELLAQIIPTLQQIRDKELILPPSQPLEDLLEILKYQHNATFEIFTLTYPYDGTRLTIAAGTTVYDFEHATVVAPDVAVVRLSDSLLQHGKSFMRSLTIDANKDVIVQLDDHDKRLVTAGSCAQFSYKQFTKLRVTATESTEILVSASTSLEPTIISSGLEDINQMNVEIRAASGALTAGETTTPVTGLGMYNIAAIRLDVTTITTADGDDEVDFYIQTSYDDGGNWLDLENIHFATADTGTTSTKVIMIAPPFSSAVARAETDGTLGDDTKLDLPLGDRIRIKTKVTGASAPTYAYNCVAAFMV